MTKQRVIWLACCIFLGGGVGVHAGEELMCPPTIAISQKATTPPPGWDVSNQAMRIEVSGVTVYDGPPTELASLRPREEETADNKFVATWKFHKKGNSGQGYWIECDYTHTNVVLSKRVPDSVGKCSAYFDKESKVENNYVFERMECK